MRRLALAAALGALAAGSALAASQGSSSVLTGTHCSVLPSDNPWNQRVDRLPVARGSAGWVASIGSGDPVHPDFGTMYNGAPNGIPFAIVTRHTKRVPVTFDYASESDRGRYPLRANVPIEGGSRSTGDRHVIVVDRDTCTDYELYAAHPLHGGRAWHAGSGAVFHLGSDKLRHAGWTSADAAGLPILPGLARYDEVARGAIDHALRVTVPCTSAKYVYPARHLTTDGRPSCPPMGLRLRLKASVSIAGLPRQARIVATALKRYGLIVADNGSAWYISGAPNSRWNDDALHQLDRLAGRDFEAVDTRSLPHPGA